MSIICSKSLIYVGTCLLLIVQFCYNSKAADADVSWHFWTYTSSIDHKRPSLLIKVWFCSCLRWSIPVSFSYLSDSQSDIIYWNWTNLNNLFGLASFKHKYCACIYMSLFIKERTSIFLQVETSSPLFLIPKRLKIIHMPKNKMGESHFYFQLNKVKKKNKNVLFSKNHASCLPS